MAPGWGGRRTWVVPSLVLQLPPTLPVNPYPQPVSDSSPHTPSFLLPVSPTKPQLQGWDPPGSQCVPTALHTSGLSPPFTPRSDHPRTLPLLPVSASANGQGHPRQSEADPKPGEAIRSRSMFVHKLLCFIFTAQPRME